MQAEAQEREWVCILDSFSRLSVFHISFVFFERNAFVQAEEIIALSMQLQELGIGQGRGGIGGAGTLGFGEGSDTSSDPRLRPAERRRCRRD